MYDQLMLTTVGRLYPVAGFIGLLLCHPLMQSKTLDIDMPTVGAVASPSTVITYILAFFARPYVFPAAIPVTCVP